tara:strand:+ start:108 stop:449 length:342 start_codon:yes stop_codon:yes gene_type:complete
MNKSKKDSRRRVRYSIRKKISGTADVPRLAIFRSNKQIYAQIIDDVTGTTLASASSMANEGNKSDQAKEVGKTIAGNAKKIGVEKVIFDRGGFLYHGRIKALAESAREAGLKF